MAPCCFLTATIQTSNSNLPNLQIYKGAQMDCWTLKQTGKYCYTVPFETAKKDGPQGLENMKMWRKTVPFTEKIRDQHVVFIEPHQMNRPVTDNPAIRQVLYCKYTRYKLLWPAWYYGSDWVVYKHLHNTIINKQVCKIRQKVSTLKGLSVKNNFLAARFSPDKSRFLSRWGDSCPHWTQVSRLYIKYSVHYIVIVFSRLARCSLVWLAASTSLTVIVAE